MYHECMPKNRKSRRAASAPHRRIVIDFPSPLLDGADALAGELKLNRSALIRAALEEYLRTYERRRLETELADACEANADLGRRISEEFAWVDSENI